LSLIHTLLTKLSSHLTRRVICREDGEPYLTRFIVWGWKPSDGDRKYPFSIYLHLFHTPDYDPAPHSHPWDWAVSLILSGGYIEERLEEDGGAFLGVYKAPALNVIKSDTFHVITELSPKAPTWTLFIVGPKNATWGFMVPKRGYVPWRDRLRERGIEPEY
jgi:hypothetical protein